MNAPARTLMVQGTASSVGKTLIVAALCRIFHREGLSVAPFKAQNMALNSFVTSDGGEIGRAQAVQAEAAGIDPRVEMNPILLKPEGGMRSQVVVLGKPLGRMTWSEYQQLKPEFVRIVADSLHSLRAKHDLIIIEGAGSPAEINLAGQDLVNMHVAAEAEAPVLLVGDIDRGGVFAHLVGTMELLAPADRERVAGFLINKFRGDVALLAPGLEFLRERFRVPVLGVIPYLERLRIADEDSVALEDRRNRRATGLGQIDIAVIKLPRISNYDDFLALEHEDDVTVRFVEEPREMAGADLAIIPGSKSTIADLGWLHESGFALAIVDRAREGGLIAGICGGCQMLGEGIDDPHRVESDEASARGLGLLPIVTRFAKTKLTAQVRVRVKSSSILSGAGIVADEISAYEIHMGNVERTAGSSAPFRIVSRNGAPADTLDGAINRDGSVAGTMLHGIFENDALRAAFLGALRRRKGLAAHGETRPVASREAEYDRLASAVADGVDLPMLRKIAGLG
ncbi:MAG: cobyric acid synthase [Candidatus Binataceae bacterium]